MPRRDEKAVMVPAIDEMSMEGLLGGNTCLAIAADK
jgi:hypothetical protein